MSLSNMSLKALQCCLCVLCRPLYMSTKNTILKQYDGRFLQIFQEIYEQVQCPGLRSMGALLVWYG